MAFELTGAEQLSAEWQLGVLGAHQYGHLSKQCAENFS
jgi:hypothetical protein